MDLAKVVGIVTSLLFACAVGAQEIDEAFHDTWRWVHFTQASGLPSNHVLNIVETGDGTPWVSTKGGLAWFDGWRWHAIDEESGLPAGDLNSFQAGPRDQIVAVSGGKVFIGGAGGFQLLPMQWRGEDIFVSRVETLDDGGLIIEEYRDDRFLFWIHRKGILEPIAGPVSGETRFDPPPTLVMGDAAVFAFEGALYRYDDGEWTLLLGEPGSEMAFRRIQSLPDGRGMAYVHHPADKVGLWEWTGSGRAQLLNPRQDNLRPRVFDLATGGNALVVYESGDVSIRRDGHWQNTGPYIPAMASCRFARFHSNGEDIWIGSDRGLYLYRKSSTLWSAWKHDGNSPRNVIHQILTRTDGSIWLATLGGLEIRHQDGSIEFIDEIDGKQVNNITALAEDGEGDVWIGSGAAFNGAYRWNGEVWRHFGRDEGLAAATIHKIRIDREGRPWFLGLASYNPHRNPLKRGPGAFVLDEGSFKRWSKPEGMASGRVYDFCEGEEGVYWFGTLAGLSRWRGGEWTHWGREDKFDRVFALEIDRSGRLWFSGQHRGIGYLEGDEPVFPAPLRGFSTEEAREFSLDSEGRLWAGSPVGVAVMCGGEWLWLSQVQGLVNPEIWPVKAMGDRILMGTLGNGTTVLDLGVLGVARPQAVLNRPGVLGHGSAEFTWEASSFWGTLPPDQIMTRYRLDHGPWSAWDLTRHVRLENLAGGRHTIEVQAQDPLRPAALPSDVVSFELTPSLARNPLFYLPIGFLTLCLIGLGSVNLMRKQRQRIALQRSEERYRRLFDTSRDGILLLTTDGCIADVNPAAQELLGRDQQALLGVRLADLCVTPSQWSDAAGLTSKASLSSVPERLDLVRGQSGVAQTEVSAGHLDLAGQPMIQLILHDVSWRLHLELNLQRARRLEALGTLAGGVAHDFNNILTAIGGFSELLNLKLDPGDPNRTAVSEIINGVDRASALTKQLLAFSRRQALKPCALDANEVIRELESMLRRLVSEDIDLAFRLDPELPFILADRAQFEQVIVNLVMNAQDAMPEGGNLDIETRWSAADDTCSILVSDTGAGMDQETLDHLFEPFFTTKLEGQGTGLGLSTVYGIVTQSNGRVDVASTPGGGTVITVVLQIASTESVVEHEHPKGCVGGEERILIVEDEESVREATAQMLNELGYRVLRAQDGETALRLVADPVHEIDLVITDIVMPGMNGPEVILQVRKIRPDLPAIYMSGYISKVAMRGAELTPDAVILNKPFNLSALAHEVRKALDIHPTDPREDPSVVVTGIDKRTPKR